MNVMEKIARLKLVPVVVLENSEDAVPLANALIKGGLPIAEITFRTAAAAESIRLIKEAFPDMLVGAGTVINVEQAQKALDAGAQFMVTPGFSAPVAEFALKHNVPIVPGVCTPTEIMMCLEYGIDLVKFFPASNYGGVKTLKALSGPFPTLRFLPTGGINTENVREYLSNPKVVACGGSWMVNGTLIKEGRFDEIEDITRQSVELVRYY